MESVTKFSILFDISSFSICDILMNIRWSYIKCDSWENDYADTNIICTTDNTFLSNLSTFVCGPVYGDQACTYD